MWLCSRSQAISSSATMICLYSAKRQRAWFRMTLLSRSCVIMLFWSLHSNFCKPIFVVRKHLGSVRHLSAPLSQSSLISSIISSGEGGRISSRGSWLRPPGIGIWAPAVPSACWAWKTIWKTLRLLNFVATFTHPAALFLLMIGVMLWAYGPPSALGPSWQPQRSRIFRWRSGRCAIAAFTVGIMVVSTINVTPPSIDSSSPGLCHEKTWVSFSPTLLTAMSASTYMMVMLNSSTWKFVEALQRSIIDDDLWSEVSSLSSSASIHHQQEEKKHRGDAIHTNLYKVPHLSQGIFEHIVPSAEANLWNLSSAALSFWPSRLVLAAMYHFQCGLLNTRSPIHVTQ